VRDSIYKELKCQRKPIGNIFELINGRAFKPDEWGEVGRKIIRIQNLKYPTATYNYYDGFVQEKHLVERGDILFAWSGQVVSLGAHIWRQEQAILNQHIFNVKPKIQFLPRFVQEGFNALIDEMKTQVRGLEMFHIRKQEIEKIHFPVTSIIEQQHIVDYLDNLQSKVDALKKLQAETAAELDALLPSVLDKAFKGLL
jgi:type I restriction enzyme S subunit